MFSGEGGGTVRTEMPRRWCAALAQKLVIRSATSAPRTRGRYAIEQRNSLRAATSRPSARRKTTARQTSQTVSP